MVIAIRKAGYCFIEARPSVQAVSMLRFLAGALLGGFDELAPRAGQLLFGGLGWLCATVAVYVYNGVADRTEDVGNGSRRPIARGQLPVRFAVPATSALTLISLGSAVFLGTAQLVMTLVYLAVGYAYSARPYPLKRGYYTTAPAVAVLGLTTYASGCLDAGHHLGPPLLVFAGANAAWMALVGAISKDLSDIAGDEAAGRRSLPVLLGVRPTLRLLALGAAVVPAGFALAAGAWAVTLLWCAAAMVPGAGIVAATSLRTSADDTRARRRLPYRAFMWTQHLNHVVLICVLAV